MKILHVLAQLPQRTGSGVYFSSMIEEFKSFNHDQRAVFALQGDYDWDLLEEDQVYPLHFLSEELPFPIAGMSDVMPYENTVYSKMTRDMIDRWKGAFRRLLEELKEDFTPDVIFAHHLWMLSSLVREVFPHTKIIGICHNTDLRQARMNPGLLREHVTNIGGLDYIFAASEEQKKEIEEIYSYPLERQVAVGGGFNQKIFYPPEKKTYSDRVRLVFCAKIDPSKGVYELIEVYKSLARDDISLDIIGSPIGENVDRIKEYIGGDESIRLYNVKDQIALGDELREKDIFLMPSYYEGLGLMAIESLACGLYVVTSEIEALMSLLGEDIKESGVISYVSLPRIQNVDEPVEEDLPLFKENLKRAIEVQIEKIKNKEQFTGDIVEEIDTHSWQGLVARMNKFIEEL